MIEHDIILILYYYIVTQSLYNLSHDKREKYNSRVPTIKYKLQIKNFN